MHPDTHGLPVSTASESAAAHYRDGLERLYASWPTAGEALDAAIAADPQFALAHAARARLHAMSSQGASARERIAAAQALVAQNGTERERSHVQVIALGVAGRSEEALAACLAHADRWPRDALILSMPLGAFGLFAFSGMADHDQARVDFCERHAAHYDDDDWWFLTSRGWALAENGEAARGRAMIERAFALRSENANAVHALTHAMFEAGAGDDAQALIADWLPTYDRSGMLHGHLAWHAALVALERGDAEQALRLYDEHVQPSVSQGLAINVVSDAASLFWRLDAYGHPVGPERWSEIAGYAGRAFSRPGHAFVDSHMLLIEAAAGNREALDRRVTALEALVAEGGLGAASVVPAIGRAALAFAAGDDAGCIRILEPVATEVVRIGGSAAQREVIEDTLLVALMRSGETEKARTLLDRRLHRRPSPRDQRWRDTLPATAQTYAPLPP